MMYAEFTLQQPALCSRLKQVLESVPASLHGNGVTAVPVDLVGAVLVASRTCSAQSSCMGCQLRL